MAEERKRRGRHNVQLQALDVFCEVVRLRSFSRGAEFVGITQSAASQVIAHLESELGFQLIDRKRRPFELTHEGEIYYEGCQKVLSGYRSVLDRIRRHQKSRGVRVRAVSVYSVGLHTVAGLLAKFRLERPEAAIRLDYAHPKQVYEAVLKDEAEFGILSYPKSHRRLSTIDWLEEEMVIACPPDHRFARRRRVPIGELEGERFVSFDSDLMIRRELHRVLRNHGVHVEIVSEFDNIEPIKSAIAISDAISILPLPSIAQQVEQGVLATARISDVELRRPVGIIHRRERELTPTAQEFIAELLSAANHLSARPVRKTDGARGAGTSRKR